MSALFPLFGAAIPEIILAIAGVGLILLGVFREQDGARLVSHLTVVVLVLVGILVVGEGHDRQMVFNGMFQTDAFAVFVKVLVIVGAALSIMLSLGYLQIEKMDRFEFPILILFATLGMMMMISANDLISLFVGMELQGLSLYVLAAFHRENARSSEAGLKYFVLGALSTGLMLYGISLVYGFAGTTNFDNLKTMVVPADFHKIGILIGLVFVLAGAAFKVAAVPFHMWTPDVYEGAPTPVTSFFAGAAKISAIGVLVRILCEPFLQFTSDWTQIVIAMSLGSVVIGSFAAIRQTNIKRLLAYSSIAHTGYGMIGLAAGNAQGARGMLIYLAIYVVMNAGAFAVVLGMRRQGMLVENVSDLAGFAKSHPLLAAAMALFMLSMAGIPPSPGFFGKLYVFMAAVEVRLYVVVVPALLASVVGAYYYLNIIKVMYFDKPDPNQQALDVMENDSIAWVLVCSTLFVLLFNFFPAALVSKADVAARALFMG
ncbi:NADH-quinone oxidoreductase subunit N [Azospirillaceae bacterium]